MGKNLLWCLVPVSIFHIRLLNTSKKEVEVERCLGVRAPQRSVSSCLFQTSRANSRFFRCGIPNCLRGEKEYPKSKAFRKHLLSKHGDRFSTADQLTLEGFIKESKKMIW